MDDSAIRVTNVHKTFRLPHERQSSVKGMFINLLHSSRTYEKQHVLKGIDFEIKKGEFFGIVGRNGSGKSTLLKLLAGIYTPDKGHIQVNGKLTPFIELGVGFNPELTGRENVYLNGALLGFNRKEMEAMYDEIVGFAELEKFMDQKLKNYSSGMQVRLAFSIAIRAKSEILVLDEVLAVGDADFQRKCYDYFGKLKRKGQTVVLVSHDMGAIQKYCDKALLLGSGEILNVGEPEDIAKEYLIENTNNYNSKNTELQGVALRKLEAEKGIKVDLRNAKGKIVTAVKKGDSLTINIEWENPDVKNIGVALIGQTGEYIFGANTILDNFKVKNRAVTYSLNMDVGPGQYIFKLGFFGQTDMDVIDHIGEGPTISVEDYKGRKWEGITELKHSWRQHV